MAIRKTASSNRDERWSLIALSDVEHVFDKESVRGLARTAKLPDGADVDRFGESLRSAVRIYLEARARLSPPQLRAAIERLHQLNTSAKRGSDQAALLLY